MQRDGPDADAVEAATKLARKCFAMGEPWVTMNHFTERYDILYVQKGFP